MDKHEEIINRYLEECPPYENSPPIGINLAEYVRFFKSCNKIIMPSELPRVRIDYKGLLEYAKKKGVEPAELSDEDKVMFISVEEDT